MSLTSLIIKQYFKLNILFYTQIIGLFIMNHRGNNIYENK